MILDNTKKLQKKQTKIYKPMKRRAIKIPILALVASVGLLVGGVSCSGGPDFVTVDTVEMLSPSTSLLVGEELQLSRIVEPPNADQGVLWLTSNKTVAPINSRGRVVGKAPGVAVITCASQEDPRIKDVLTLQVLAANE